MPKAKRYTYDYPMVGHTVDAVVFGVNTAQASEALHLLLIQRGDDPFKDSWALPGGYVHIDEEAVDAVSRELKEETTVDLKLSPLGAFSGVGRDPRGRVLSEAFMTLVCLDRLTIEGRDDAKEARWFSTKDLPQLAFDHHKIITMAFSHLETQLVHPSLDWGRLLRGFQIEELPSVYGAIQETLKFSQFERFQ